MDVLETLGIEPWTFFLHTINFVVLILLLSRFLYRPVVGMLDERTRRIEQSLAEAERARAEVAQADREREELLAATRRELQEMRTQAEQLAERIESEARTSAQQEAQRIIERARQEADAERQQAMIELRREVATLAVQAAERVIRQNLDTPAQRRLVEEFLADQPNGAGRV